MRKVLLATTALGMGAGVAFAQDMGMADDGMMMDMAPAITLSGDGRMGVISDMDDNLKFSSRIRITVKAAATLDNGLSAGGEVRTDQNGTGGKAGKIFLSGPFGKLTMGDVDAGAKAAVGNVDGVGYVNQGDPNEITYLRGGGGDDPTLQYMLPKMGPVQVYASIGMAETPILDSEGDEQPEWSYEFTNDGPPFDSDGSINRDVIKVTEGTKNKTEISADTLSIGAKADLAISDMGSAWIGGGFEATTSDTADGHLVFGAGAEVSGFTGKVVVGMQGRDSVNADGDAIDPDTDNENAARNRDREQFAVSAGYSAGQMGVTVFYTQSDFRNKDGHREENGHEALGAGFSWSLGGGAELKAGFTNWPAQEEGKEDKQTADLGVTFAF